MHAKAEISALQPELQIQSYDGVIRPVNPASEVQLHCENRSGKLYLGDSLAWLKGLESETVDLVFADPPCNINKAEWDNFESHSHYVEWSREWLQQAARVLNHYRLEPVGWGGTQSPGG